MPDGLQQRLEQPFYLKYENFQKLKNKLNDTESVFTAQNPENRAERIRRVRRIDISVKFLATIANRH